MSDIISTLTIPISELPDCYAKEQLCELVIDPKTTYVNVVAKAGGIDWAAYIGFPTNIMEIRPEYRETNQYYVDCVSTPEQVKSNGDKLDKKTALALFPFLESGLHGHYRH